MTYFYPSYFIHWEPKEIPIGEPYYRHQFFDSKRRLVETREVYYNTTFYIRIYVCRTTLHSIFQDLGTAFTR